MTTRIGMMLAHFMNRKQEDTTEVRLVSYCPLSRYQRFCHPSCNWWDTVRCMYPIPAERMAIGNIGVAAGTRGVETRLEEVVR